MVDTDVEIPKKLRTLACDVETSGLDLFHGCKVFSIAAADGDLEQTWFWCFEVDARTRTITVNEDMVAEVQRLIDEYDEIVFHNAAFDFIALWQIGIRIPWHKVRDTLILSHVLHSIGPHGLKYLRIQHLNLPTVEQEVLGKIVKSLRAKAKKRGYPISGPENKKTPSAKDKAWQGDMHLIVAMGNERQRQALEDYNVSDAMDTWTLYRMMTREIAIRGHEWQVEWRMDSLQTAISMRIQGVTLSKTAIRETWNNLRRTRIEHGEVCKSIAPSINLESPQQLQKLFFEDWRLPKTKRTEGGGHSTDAKSIEFLLEQKLNATQRRFLESFQKYNKVQTGLGYIKDYIRFSVPVPGHPDYIRIHTSWNVVGTAWTRWASSAPNQQNISKQKGVNLRSIYAPLPGKVWYSFDQDNVELRIFAWDSGDQNLIDAYLRGESVHLIFARVVYPQEWADCGGDGELFKERYPEEYQRVKNGDFAIVYGAAKRKADSTYGVKGAFDRIRKEMPLVDEYLGKHQQSARENGYIETMLGYRLYVSSDAPHKASNGRIQGTASQVLQIVTNKLRRWLSQHHPQCRLLLNIHDEVIVEAPEDYDFPATDVARVLMDTGLNFPITVGCKKITSNWSVSEKVALAL